MSRRHLILALLLILSGCGGELGGTQAEAGVVEWVADGDTIVLANGLRVRLVQIDAPELEGAECYGEASKAELERLLPIDTRVRLEFDKKLDRVDRFGRQLAYVFSGPMNVNVTMVRRGAAGPYFFGGDRGRYGERLLRTARQARGARRGLWSVCSGTKLDPGRAIETRG